MEIVQKYFTEFTPKQLQQFEQLAAVYKEWNDKINVISRKDIDSLYEKHVLHSLAIARVVLCLVVWAANEEQRPGIGRRLPARPRAGVVLKAELDAQRIKHRLVERQRALEDLQLLDTPAEPDAQTLAALARGTSGEPGAEAATTLEPGEWVELKLGFAPGPGWDWNFIGNCAAYDYTASGKPEVLAATLEQFEHCDNMTRWRGRC